VESKFLLSIQCFGYITRECLPTPGYSPLHCALLNRDSNIDRLFAIWQALHNDTVSNPTFVAPSGKSIGTRVIAGGKKQDANTPLAPFNASEEIGKFWTSTTAENTKKFGHVYPETRDWVYKTPADIKSQLISLYSYGSLSTMFNKPSTKSNLVSRARLHSLAAQTPLPKTTLESVQTDGDKIPEEIEQKAASVEIPTDRDPKDLVIDNKYLEWLVDIKAEKHANNGDFVVHVFLCDPQDDNPALYIFNHNHVAAFSTLGQGSGTGCEKCKVDQAERIEVTGQIPLTLALVERYQAGLVDGLTPEVVEPYLAQNLHWRVVTRDAQPIPRDQINGLLIGVVTCEVTLPTDANALPQYAATVVPRPAATTKKQGDWSGNQPEGRGDGTGYTGGDIPVLT
jgi:tyrosinase